MIRLLSQIQIKTWVYTLLIGASMVIARSALADSLPDEGRAQLSELWVLHGLSKLQWASARDEKILYLGRIVVLERESRNVLGQRYREKAKERGYDDTQIGPSFSTPNAYKRHDFYRLRFFLSKAEPGASVARNFYGTEGGRKRIYFVVPYVWREKDVPHVGFQNTLYYDKRIPEFGVLCFERGMDLEGTIEAIYEWSRSREWEPLDKDLLNAFHVHAFPEAWKEDFSEALRRFSSIPEENRLEELRSGSDAMSDFLVYLLVQGLSEEELRDLDVFAILERKDDPVLRKAVWYEVLDRSPNGSALDTFREKLGKDALGSGLLEAFLWAYAAKQSDESKNFIFAFLYRFETPERVADGPYSLRARAGESGRSGYDVRDPNFSLFVDVAGRLEETEKGRRVVDQLYWVLYDTAIGFEPEPVLGHWKRKSEAVTGGEKGKEAD